MYSSGDDITILTGQWWITITPVWGHAHLQAGSKTKAVGMAQTLQQLCPLRAETLVLRSEGKEQRGVGWRLRVIWEREPCALRFCV